MQFNVTSEYHLSNYREVVYTGLFDITGLVGCQNVPVPTISCHWYKFQKENQGHGGRLAYGYFLIPFNHFRSVRDIMYHDCQAWR